MDPKDRIIAGSFQCQAQLTQQRSLVITGHVYGDDQPGELNKRIDEMQDALDRQLVRVDLTNKIAQKASMEAHLAMSEEQMEKLQTKQEAATNGGKRLSSQERQTLEQGKDALDGMRKNIVSLAAAIIAAKQKLGVTE